MKTALLIALFPALLLSPAHVSACYDPSTQRWLNRDPIAECGGINLYAFTFNNPVSFVDVFGNDPACSAFTGFGMGMHAEQLTQFSETAAPAAVALAQAINRSNAAAQSMGQIEEQLGTRNSSAYEAAQKGGEPRRTRRQSSRRLSKKQGRTFKKLTLRC